MTVYNKIASFIFKKYKEHFMSRVDSVVSVTKYHLGLPKKKQKKNNKSRKNTF